MTRERRIIVIVGALLLMAGLIYRFQPFDRGAPGGGQIEMKQKMLAKYSQVIKGNQDIDKRLARAEKSEKAILGMLLTGASPALAAVDIQNTLARLGERTKVNIDRVNVKKPNKFKKGSILAIPVQFNVDSSVRQLRDLITAIESSNKLLRIIEMTCRATQKEGSAVTVRTTMTIEGFIFEG